MKRSLVIMVIILLVIAGLSAFIFLRNPAEQKPFSTTTTPNISELSEDSYISNDTEQTVFSMYKKDSAIYTANSKGKQAAREFLNAMEKHKGIVPANSDTSLQDHREEQEDSGMEHYYYTQMVAGIPVYGSSVAVHIKLGNQIYAADGNVTKTGGITKATLSDDQAKQIALSKAKEDSGDATIWIGTSSRQIINKQLLGIDNDATNYVTLAVAVESQSGEVPFDSVYFVDLTKGDVLFVETRVLEVMQRQIRDARKCNPDQNHTACPLIRGEGTNATGDSDVDTSYDYLGQGYEYFKKNHNRDSYDNRGSILYALPKYPIKTQQNNYDCRNAYWTQKNYMALCQNMVANDVVMHELTHGVTMQTSNLILSAQSGALNESFSDIFATAIDEDWTIGEDTVLGILRSFENPPSKNHPDKMYSNLYKCEVPNGCVRENDYCGVHFNSSILNKAYYLMITGGEFNGCTVAPVEKQMVLNVMYRTLTVYLNKTSNFRDAYSKILRSCDELYNDEVCTSIENGLKAVELDQQPAGTQKGPKCSGITRKQPSCKTVSAEPTDSPDEPTKPPANPSKQPPTAPTSGTARPSPVAVECKPKYKPDTNGCEQPTLVAPGERGEAGEITFTWCTSTPQAGYNFRLAIDSKASSEPDVVQDRIKQSSVTLNVKEGTHGWWVHSFCQDNKNGYLSPATGRSLILKKATQKAPVSTQAPNRTTATTVPLQQISPVEQGGSSQRRME